jgi:hypothetical protein
VSEVAYELRAQYEGNYAGGVLFVDDRREINVFEALKEGQGQIVVGDQDHVMLAVLDEYPPLKRVRVKEESKRELPEVMEEEEEPAGESAGGKKSASSGAGKEKK